MPKVEFLLNKEKDAWNCWDKSNQKENLSSFKINEKIKKICLGKEFKECKQELLDYLKKFHDSRLMDITIKAVSDSWKEIEKEFFKRMDKLMKHHYDLNIKAYITTLGICPYDPDEPSFMFSFFQAPINNLKTCGHEIMHLYFHKFYWKKVEKGIGEKNTWDLKEALTVLLNHEFKDLWFVSDNGYEPHKKLRDFISEQWKKEKDFDVLIEKCIGRYNKQQ